MSAQESIIANLESLPSTALQRVADFVQQLRQRTAIDRQLAFDASFGSMSAAEADAFDRAIEEGCEQLEP